MIMLWRVLGGVLAAWMVVLLGPVYWAYLEKKAAQEEKEKYEIVYEEGLWGDFVPVRVLKNQKSKKACTAMVE